MAELYGSMICKENGSIIRCDAQMKRLMVATTGTLHRNGRQFYASLTLGELTPGCSLTWYEGQSVCTLPDGSAWLFVMSAIQIKNKKVRQLTAAEISERLTLTTELWEKNKELARRQAELNATMANLHVLSREQETQRAKMRAHDILGERLTLMLRFLRGEREMEYPTLRSLSRELIDELKAAQNEVTLRDRLDVLTRVFASVGVRILYSGELPEDAERGRLIADIAREAVTNAVRHGFATQVNIEFIHRGVRITNNGRAPSEPITEGGGLAGMREKVKLFGGKVTVSASPCFSLTVELSGGDGVV
ncbi:MAG: hypothetical protein LBR72_04020 [Oscillospiraceae bacterium]|jgi:glucose-6-phosphate-specific signal transduction histidine kinase|nr:hypothetical protein [Oscillospiraceae bacterium]